MLHKKPESVLTHGGGSRDAITSAISTRAEHHEHEHPHLHAGTTGPTDIPVRHMASPEDNTDLGGDGAPAELEQIVGLDDQGDAEVKDAPKKSYKGKKALKEAVN